ncbi:hypothetical protein HW49_00300 [Porphyromonadaceae bacterium COT-184 OH4590]|nr:hypothetical protein HW49_00300 [Porphyromonadaceae bacterium COT-184 OH4590]
MKKIITFAILALIMATPNIFAQNVNMSCYIVLSVDKGKEIQFDLKALADQTPVKIVNGSKEHIINVDNNEWLGLQTYVAEGNIITIYGDIIGLDCNSNETGLTAIDVSNNLELVDLMCSENSLTSINVRANTKLETLFCSMNQISNIDLSNNNKLAYLDCSKNKISSLDLSKNTNLEILNVALNSLNNIDLSKNTELTFVDCSNNVSLNSIDIRNNINLLSFACNNTSITSLDVSKNNELKFLYCYDCKFTTQTLDDLYCSLSDRVGEDVDNGILQPIFSSTSSNYDIVMATNGNNAKKKKWSIQYFDTDSDIPDTKGKYMCPTSNLDNILDISAVIYPNPVDNILYIQADEKIHSIKVYNMYGIEVANINGSNQINIAHLPSGVYSVIVAGAKGSNTYRAIKR